MKKFKSILLIFLFIFMKIISYGMFVLAGAILIKQMPNPELITFIFNVFLAFVIDFCASIVNEMDREYD